MPRASQEQREQARGAKERDAAGGCAVSSAMSNSGVSSASWNGPCAPMGRVRGVVVCECNGGGRAGVGSRVREVWTADRACVRVS